MSFTDRAKEALLAILSMGTPRIDYYTTYRCRVVKQSADLTKVDIKPDDKRIPQRSDVPIKWGIPGVKAKIVPGCFVNHGWDNGDPSQPYVALIEGGAVVQEITIETTQKVSIIGATEVVFNRGALAVARQTDQVTGQAGPYPLASGMIANGNQTVKA